MAVMEIYVLHCRKFGKAEKYTDKNLSDPNKASIRDKNYYQVGVSNSFMCYIELIN